MQSKTRTLTLFAFAAALAMLPFLLSKPSDTPKDAPRPTEVVADPTPHAAGSRRIQLALLLDTSSSMDGLIGQAKTELWRVVNELGRAKHDGVRPELEIALYEYGKSSVSAERGFIRQVLPFTHDLDRVSEELFALTTNGGEEYCGQVIDTATKELAWSDSPKDLKLLFIAGNEPFSQGPVDFHRALKGALERGITVSTIFCGDEKEGAATGWKEGALLADGRYLAIDQTHVAEYVAAPQDDEIAALGTKLNTTYVPYGGEGAASAARQVAQDSNASAWRGSFLARQASKASANYSNPTWDLVDAKSAGRVDVGTLDVNELPSDMRRLSVEERRAYVEAKAKERAEIKAKIAKLDADRRAYVAAEQAKRASGPVATLDQAMLQAVRDQASKRGYQFE